MIEKLLVYIIAISCLASCKSQNKEETIQFDLNTPKIHYLPVIGELRGKIKEITETSSISKDYLHNGKSEILVQQKYVFDNDKNIIYCYANEKLSSTVFFDKKWLIDSLIYYNGHHFYEHKTPLHGIYKNYSIENGIKLESKNKVDLIQRTVSISDGNKIIAIDSFDVKNRLVQTKSLIRKDCYNIYKYNDEGDLIATNVKLPNQKEQPVGTSEYEYDQNRNWIKKIHTNGSNDLNPTLNSFKTISKRKIIYDSN
jgi:hypothetical protein